MVSQRPCLAQCSRPNCDFITCMLSYRTKLPPAVECAHAHASIVRISCAAATKYVPVCSTALFPLVMLGLRSLLGVSFRSTYVLDSMSVGQPHPHPWRTHAHTRVSPKPSTLWTEHDRYCHARTHAFLPNLPHFGQNPICTATHAHTCFSQTFHTLDRSRSVLL